MWRHVAHLVVDDREPLREPGHHAFEGHHRVSRRGPLQADDARHVDEPLDEGARREPEAGPVRVVDDEADVGRAGAREDVVEEVALRVRVVERRRDLDVVGPDARRGPDQPLQLQRGRRLAADRDRHPTSAASTAACQTATRSSNVIVEKSPAAPPARSTALPVVAPPSIEETDVSARWRRGRRTGPRRRGTSSGS